jgi:hypothetical protein
VLFVVFVHNENIQRNFQRWSLMDTSQGCLWVIKFEQKHQHQILLNSTTTGTEPARMAWEEKLQYAQTEGWIRTHKGLGYSHKDFPARFHGVKGLTSMSQLPY